MYLSTPRLVLHGIIGNKEVYSGIGAFREAFKKDQKSFKKN